MTQTTMMKDITDEQLIAEFKERFCIPNFFSKKHVEEIQGDITDDQWEKFKDDYNSYSGVHSVASETFTDDVAYMFDAQCHYESESESESEDESESESESESEDEEDEDNVKCWTCDKNPATHSTFRDALNEYERTCDECHRQEYPEQYEDEEEDFKKILYELEHHYRKNESLSIWDVANEIERFEGDDSYNRALSNALIQGWIEEGE